MIRELQIELNDQGAVIKVLPHLARPSDRIAKEVLAVICIMLFNANASVQVGHFLTCWVVVFDRHFCTLTDALQQIFACFAVHMKPNMC